MLEVSIHLLTIPSCEECRRHFYEYSTVELRRAMALISRPE